MKPPWPHSQRRFALGVGFLAIAGVILAWGVLEGWVPSLSGSAKSGPSVPAIQELSTAGESWAISDTAARVVNYTQPLSGAIWMNFTVASGGLSVFACFAGTTASQASTAALVHCWAGGETGPGTGSPWFAWGNATHTTPAELIFINYGPGSGSTTTVLLTWSTPLVVLST